MKVPDMPAADNSLNDMTAFRKKKKRLKILRNIIILAVIIAIGVVIYIFRDEIAKPLKGIASGLTGQTAQGGGFPVKLPGSSEYTLLSVGNDFALVTDTYFYTYNSAGGQEQAVQHGYVNPAAVSTEKRALIYDRGGHDFALYSSGAEMFKQSVNDETIVSAFIGAGDKSAIVTSGGRYSNVVYVYDGTGKWLYTRKFIDENVMQADFSDDGKYLFLTLVRSNTGDIVTEVCKYDISSEEKELWKYSISDSLPYALKVSGNTVTAVEDNAVYSLNADTGEETGRYSFDGELIDFDIGESGGVYVLDYYAGNGKTVTVLDNTCAEVSEKGGYDTISDIKLYDSEMCILSGRDIVRVKQDFTEISKARLEHDFSAFVRAGSMYLMLGYDTIEKANL